MVRQKRYPALNSPVVVPVLEVSLEDFLICAGTALAGLGLGGFLSSFCLPCGVFVSVFGVLAGVVLLFTARRERKRELDEKGVSRGSVLRRVVLVYHRRFWWACRRPPFGWRLEDGRRRF